MVGGGGFRLAAAGGGAHGLRLLGLRLSAYGGAHGYRLLDVAAGRGRQPTSRGPGAPPRAASQLSADAADHSR